ncbi:MAG: hypothetical protein IJ637_05560 [Prevotella sp.]|nr:hypothetical protein [Prevotella sp.]
MNINGQNAGVSKRSDSSEGMAEAEFVYGGGFFGPICGNTVINLGKGRVFNTFGGSCMADILGYSETYIGRQAKADGTYEEGFPWVRDIVYGGNDLGGKIMGEADFTSRVRSTAGGDDFNTIGMVHNTAMLSASSYVEYTQGRADAIFGGCYGTYDYSDTEYRDYFDEDGKAKEGYTKPRMGNAFVNFRPTLTAELKANPYNSVNRIYGSGQGYTGDAERDIMQRSSYLLIDIPQGMDENSTYDHYKYMEVFGGGSWNGLGMQQETDSITPEIFSGWENAKKDSYSACIDLARGHIGAAYGGSLSEGVVRRSWVNVPKGSTIEAGSLFAGGYGSDIYKPCDVYEGHVEYHSADALLVNDRKRKDKSDETVELGHDVMLGAIYGGNNDKRRTLYGFINIDVPVRQNHYEYGMTTGTVYGAGYGSNTWNEYTEVNLNKGAEIYEVYGGGEAGGVMSPESVKQYYDDNPAKLDGDEWKAAWTVGGGYDPESYDAYHTNKWTSLSNPLVRTAEIDDRATKTYKYNTNVIIKRGATVNNYAYGGGYGKEGDVFVGSGDVYGTTYIALLGGEVKKDVYAAGTRGAVYNAFGATTFTASATAYIEGGTCRNVYGGGWEGDVGSHPGVAEDKGIEADPNSTANDILGETHVVIGIRADQAEVPSDYGFYKGVPTVQRNAYSGGEGGAVFGTAHLTLNNGYIGYVHLQANEEQDEQGNIVTAATTTKERYEEKLTDETYYVDKVWQGKDRLRDCGNVFGGGYDVQSSVDTTYVTIWGGTVRNSVHGGAEIATVGRGAARENGALRELTAIYKGGATHVTMYNGHVLRNVFGGGKGYNIWGYGQQGTRYTDGYVFGSTEVNIRGGEIGTKEGVEEGYGNVFGGGDIGYIYSSSYFSGEHTESTGSPGHKYYKDGSSEHNLTEDCKVVVSPYLQIKDDGSTVNFGGKTYGPYDYVPTDYLNTLGKKPKGSSEWPAGWDNLITEEDDGTERGITIHNGVFGGGNVSSNSDTQYANATTIYGNTTATLYDVYHRDFISVGTEHTGGLYGGGNLSLVDGYRELNITNYGTDYYGLESQITLDEYRSLSNRERAYFQLQYQCKVDVVVGGVPYKAGDMLKEDEYLKLLEKYGNVVKNSFEAYGFCSIYAGRLLNTIQRADFCGVFGSRMVLQGAKDRVADVGEDIDYTINRVGELSLNQQRTVRTGEAYADNPDTGDALLHGNYFGIYSLVNYMGNLTSDVSFGDRYIDGNEKMATNTDSTYYFYKSSSYNEGTPSSNRNNGSSHNEVALASGVFLELTTENSTVDHKDYGYITGVVELDLINVKKESVGGGFVYAKNEHRVPMYYPNKKNVLLSHYNQIEGNQARTNKRYYYVAPAADELTAEEIEDHDVISVDRAHVYQEMVWQTSGNFIHPSKRIVDDCYPTNNAYLLSDPNHSEAHYWYVKGEVYVYDQKVSAYTGAANAYSKEVHLPLTITAASHGRLQLLNVKPNLYAYYTHNPNSDDDTEKVKIGSVNDAHGNPVDKVWVNNESDSYGLNDVITWWDWHQMSYKDRQMFVAETYVNCVACTIDGKQYGAGEYVLSDADFAKFKGESHTIRNSDGTAFLDDKGADIGLQHVFRSSNNIGHESGYVLTFDMNSPDIWNDYYTRIETSATEKNKIRESEYESLLKGVSTAADSLAIMETWREGPTFTPETSGVYGQRHIEEGDIITAETAALNKTTGEGAATVEIAYVAKSDVNYDYKYRDDDGNWVKDGDDEFVLINKTTSSGTGIPKSEYDYIVAADASLSDYFAPAYVCTQTIKLGESKYLGYGELKTEAEITELKTTYKALAKDIENAMTRAYICSTSGNYGGQQFLNTTNYSALTAWCSLPKTDRIDSETSEDKFKFNYDAFDILSSPDYLKVKVDDVTVSNPDASTTAGTFKAPYTDQVGVEYIAEYKAPTEEATYTYPAGSYLDGVTVNGSTTYSGGTLTDGQSIPNEVFEAAVRNDKAHYTKVSIASGGETIYIATDNFVYNGLPYGKGQIVDADIWASNGTTVKDVHFDNESATAAIRYYCFEEYKDKDGNTVELGNTISETAYSELPNDQKYFVIKGKEPTETTTLYVSSESDIYDVSKERVYTVVYQYSYYEEDDDKNMKMTNELHVVNIHIQLESGAPSIGTLNPPGTVLPNSAVGLKAPDVKPGLYEVITNGWELFRTEADAIHHRNGSPFTNNGTPVYWYQNQKNYIAFYSKTYLGKTYSNYVPLSVANYHDLDAVMNDKDHHLYVDRSDVDRPSKIYIDNRECKSNPDKSELDLLKDFFDLSVLSSSSEDVSGGRVTADGALKDHALLDSHVRAGRNLEFFLNSDVSPKAYAATTATPAGTGWTPLGNNNTTGDTGQCFEGTLHGDGHTISGLDHSLFGHLCGEVYNLGVTGSFTSAGIADEGDGYVENCWIKSSATSGFPAGTKAVFGNPTRDDSDSRGSVQLVNSYYPASNAYTVPASSTHGLATQMPDQAFYNGTVAYNLNGFYLKKRYYDATVPATVPGGSSPVYIDYRYLPSAADGTLPATMVTAKYPDDDYHHYQPIGTDETPNLGYVENRYYDGDFIYAGGSIPESNNMRMRSVTTTEGGITTTKRYYAPIWPDDYIFFGQRLTYGHVDGRPHQETPSAINRESERIVTSNVGNRVYRAPAYFRSGNMGVAHFNPAAVFAQTKKDDASIIAYKDMTAIDFTGGNSDVTGANNDYEEGKVTAAPYNNIIGGAFFPPLLDDDGLTSFQNVDLTRNLLVYTSNGEGAAHKTDSVVSNYLRDETYRETDTKYRTVAAWDSYADFVRGHWVQRAADGNYWATRDHMLVDRQDFNAPIGYRFNRTSRMWYQRKPDNYVSISWVDDDDDDETPLVRTTNGWEGISLPFTAEVVTTHQKGELTHFYNATALGSSAAESGRVGHEYWLRQFTGISDITDKEVKATLEYPLASNADGQKNYANTFLWDYYYSHNDYDDQNGDDYQEDDDSRTYYKQGREYPDYPRMAAATPYIIGFPGASYYEFDLSGAFNPLTARDQRPDYPRPEQLEKQVITFASQTGITIDVSDDEMAAGTSKTSGGKTYSFKPSYMNSPAVASGQHAFLLNAEGNSYVESDAATADVVAFRPYFEGPTLSSPAPGLTRSIVFVGGGSSNGDYEPHGAYEPNEPNGSADGTESVAIGAHRHNVVVTSALRTAETVRIVSTSGVTVASYTIEPGQTVETPVNIGGVYIVKVAGGRYTKKLAVK